MIIVGFLFEYADIDECQQGSPCDLNAACANNAGSYTCTCNSGYFGNGTSCTGKRRECCFMLKRVLNEMTFKIVVNWGFCLV